jgi:glycosyltransferase involved in cell wall biosynthesis
VKIMLVDLWAGGHNARYFDRFTTALGGHSVIAVAPEAVLSQRTVASWRSVAVPLARSAPVYGRPEESWHDSIVREIELIERLAAELRPDLIIHLFADHLVPHAERLAAVADTALIVLFPSGHYVSSFGSALTAEEAARGGQLSAAVAAFRAARGAVCVFTLDPVAAREWGRSPGAPAVWLPEPWIGATLAVSPQHSTDLLFFGALAHRKGFGHLAAALLFKDAGRRLVVAGWVEQDGYEADLGRQITQLRAAGIAVDLRLGRLDERGCVELLANSGVAVLPYPRHFGMSRVLLEAAHTATPVVVNAFGLLGHLVQSHGLGVATDVTDPALLSSALIEAEQVAGDPDFAARCAEFAGEHTCERFRTQLRAGLGI